VPRGNAFPESTATWVQKTLPVKKMGDSIPMSSEFLYDYSMLADEVRTFLAQNLSLLEDTQLLTGTGLTTNMTGLETYASAYTASASGISGANLADLVLKVKEDIQLGTQYRPNFILLNDADWHDLLLQKTATTNEYIDVPFVDTVNLTIAGIKVILTNTVTANTFVMGESSRAKIYTDGDIKISLGWVGSQFQEDQVTLKASKRENLLIKDRDKAAFRKVTDIDAALVTLAS
jgi:HK97 family phage major capsid protein